MEKVGTWGSYLAEEHTLHHFKAENWYPDISCRKLFERWVEDGAEDMLAVAHKKSKSILSESQTPYIDNALMKELDYVIKTEM